MLCVTLLVMIELVVLEVSLIQGFAANLKNEYKNKIEHKNLKPEVVFHKVDILFFIAF